MSDEGVSGKAVSVPAMRSRGLRSVVRVVNALLPAAVFFALIAA